MIKLRSGRGSRHRLFIGTMCGVLLFAAGCRNAGSGAGTSAEGNSQKRGRIVLVIEGTSFTTADFDAYILSTMGDKGKGLEVPALSRLFDGFVDEKILLKRAQGQGLSLTENEKRGYLAKLRTAMEADTNPMSSSAAVDEVLFERLLVEKYLYMVVKDITVDDKDVAAYYNARKADYLQPEKVQVSQILLPTEGQASEIRERLKGVGEEDFRRIARAESAGPEAPKGGVMGIFSAGQLPPELEKFIFPLKEGEISRVVVSTYGFHIFRLDKKFESRLVPLGEAAPSIKAKLLDEKGKQAVAAHLEALKASMTWTSRPENLPFAYQRTPQ